MPTPASGPSQAYVWYETDTGIWWAYAAGAWENVGGFGATISPTSLSTSQNNYNPTGLATAGVMLLTAGSAVNITGLTAPTPANNQTIIVTVIASSSTITLKAENASSTAANRFGISADLALAAEQSALLSYDSTNSRWRVVGGGSGGGGGVSSIATTDGTLYFSSSTGAVTADVQVPLIPGGRLTLTSGTPVMTANATAQTTVYYDSYNHGYVPVWNGTRWVWLAIGSDEISMGLDAVTPHVASGSLYDVFGINNSGTLVIAIGPAWSSTSSRGSGAGTTQLARKNGVFTNAVSLTHAWGGASGTTDYGAVSANQGTYLGTIYATANGQTGMNFNPAAANGGTNNILGLYNAYNRVRITAECADSMGGVDYTYASTTWRTANNNNSNRISWVDGLQQSSVLTDNRAAIYANSTSMSGAIGVNLDATTGAPTLSGQSSYLSASATTVFMVSVAQPFLPQLGFHFAQRMEVTASGTATFTGSAVTPTRQNNAMMLTVDM